ncbi:hypothetical protein ABW19_dt0209646 [Dactylella cylindrospora]|nr:hypothetical protein ABW19_dt0209646 [Dactylella cylindrospora]
MASKGRTKVADNVISLLSSSSGDELDTLPPPKRASSTKENLNDVAPKRTTTTKPLEKSTSSGNITKPHTKPTDKSKPLSTSTATKKAATKRPETITIISSSPPNSPPQPQAQPLAYPTKPYPKIFGALSSDPIFSQSSPPLPPSVPNHRSPSRSPKPASKSNAKTRSIFDSLISSDGLISDDSDILPGSKPHVPSNSKGGVSTTTAATIPSYSGLSKTTQSALQILEDEEPERTTKRRKVDRIDLDISDSSPPPLSAPARKGKLTEAEKEARKAERETARLAKVAAKEAVKEQKEAEKEAKIVAKNESQAMATANKLKGSHVTTAREMIVNISSDLFQARAGIQLQAFLSSLEVQTAPFDSTIPNIVKWRRIVEAEWDAEDDVFVPIPREIRDERHVLKFLDASEFASLASSTAEMSTLIARIKSMYPNYKVIVVIEGLTKLVNKTKNSQTRAYAAEVRNRMNEGTSGGKARANKSAVEVDEDTIEDALLRLQVVHDCLISHTVGYMDTAEAISSYTQHISQIPYK